MESDAAWAVTFWTTDAATAGGSWAAEPSTSIGFAAVGGGRVVLSDERGDE